MLCEGLSIEQLLVSFFPSGDDEGERPGALKRFSAMWSSFRRGKRDSEYDITLHKSTSYFLFTFHLKPVRPEGGPVKLICASSQKR